MAQWKLIAIAIMMMPRLSPAEQRTALAAAPSVRVIQPAQRDDEHQRDHQRGRLQ
jgi:hypothetical protein